MANSIGTKLGNINGETFSMNYINVKHLVRLYDARVMQSSMTSSSITSQPTLMGVEYATWQQYLTLKRYELTKNCNYKEPSKLGKQDEQ